MSSFGSTASADCFIPGGRPQQGDADAWEATRQQQSSASDTRGRRKKVISSSPNRRMRRQGKLAQEPPEAVRAYTSSSGSTAALPRQGLTAEQQQRLAAANLAASQGDAFATELARWQSIRPDSTQNANSHAGGLSSEFTTANEQRDSAAIPQQSSGQMPRGHSGADLRQSDDNNPSAGQVRPCRCHMQVSASSLQFVLQVCTNRLLISGSD